MGSPAAVALPSDVPQGQTIDISVDMVAPLVPGTYQGNWKLKNASGAWFGLGPGAGPFWVKIKVVGTGTPGTSGTPTATSTGTSGVQASGTRTLMLTNTIDLDTGTLNSGSGSDLVYEPAIDTELYLSPIAGTVMALFGPSKPTLADCQAASMDNSSLPLLGYGYQYICYRTNQGLYGYLYLQNYSQHNNALTIQFLTWTAP